MTIALLTLSCGCPLAYVWPSGDPPAVGTTATCEQGHGRVVVTGVSD